tara:strand:- start:471282 stop:472979 length:1698 start_codon:yes stop_codon:yes gene_type:complete
VDPLKARATFYLYFLFVINIYSLGITEHAQDLGTLNSVNNGFGTVEECEEDDSLNGCSGKMDDALKDILDLATVNQCVASHAEVENSGIDIPNCPQPGTDFRGLDHTFPSGGIFAMYMGNNSAFLQNLIDEYRKDNPAGRFNLVIPRGYIDNLKEDEELTKKLNQAQVNIVQVEAMPSVERWMQDSFEFGTLNGKPALYQLEHHTEQGRDLSTRLTCAIAKSCNVPYLIPPDMVDPNNADYNSLNSGGNLETMPGGTMYRGTIQTDGFPKYNTNGSLEVPFESQAQKVQRESLEANGNKLLDLDTSFLSVGHVDEIINFVQTNQPAPCNFALLLASPRKAFELMESTANQINLEKENEGDAGFIQDIQNLLIPKAHAGAMKLFGGDDDTPSEDIDCEEVSYNELLYDGAFEEISEGKTNEVYERNCIDDQSVTTFVDSDEYQILKRENLEGPPSIEDVMNRNKDALLRELAQTSGCSAPPVVEVPVFFRGGVAYAPDLVNGVVHTNQNNTSTIIMPRTYFRPFDQYMEDELTKLGVGATFVHGLGYHLLNGQVHCGTNTARICKQ